MISKLNFSFIKNQINKLLLTEDASPLFKKESGFFNQNINFNICKFGIKNKNKIFYVIKRTPGAGLFSNVIYVLNHLLVAEKNKFIPIIDMENFTTIYNEKEKINNT